MEKKKRNLEDVKWQLHLIFNGLPLLDLPPGVFGLLKIFGGISIGTNWLDEELRPICQLQQPPRSLQEVF